MTEGEQEKVEETTAETAQDAATEEATQTKTYTQEQVDALLGQIKTDHEKAYKGIQRTLTEKDRKLKELESTLTPAGSHIPTIKATIDVLADEANLDPARVQKLAQLRSQLAQEENALRFDAQRRTQQKVVNEKYDELRQKATEAGLDLDDDSLGSVMDAFDYARDVNGDFGKAFKRLDKVIEKVKGTNEAKGDGKNVGEKKPETEAQIRERIERETLEKYGLNKSEKVTPTGRGGRYWTKKEIAEMSPDEYQKNRDDIWNAYQANRVK